MALHRAAYLARTNQDARVLLTTYSDTLANALQNKLNRLLKSEPRLAERIDVYSINAIGARLYNKLIGPVSLVSPEIINEVIMEASTKVSNHKFRRHFLESEWEEVVDGWQLKSWDGYITVGFSDSATLLSSLPITTKRYQLRHVLSFDMQEMN